MIVLAHPTGNRFVEALLGRLHADGLLAEFATSVAVRHDAWWLSVVPGRIRREGLRRAFAGVPHDRIATRPIRDLVRVMATHAGCTALTRHETGWACVDAVYREVDKRLALRLPKLARQHHLTGIYAYEDGAEASFLAAEDLGLRRFYDLPIAYWQTSRRLLEEEAVRLPAWEPTLGGTKDSPAKFARKTRELELADVVVCPSQFVVDSLPPWARAGKTIVMAPFGSPEKGGETEIPPSPSLRRGKQRSGLPAIGSATVGSRLVRRSLGDGGSDGRKLRVLFAGSMSQRKGLADLFSAMKRLARTDVELVVMGSPIVALDFYRREYPDFIHEPTRPHAEVLRLMRSCDLLVLPSIVEGRALVMQEAMSQGLPIIITPNTGGEDLIEPGKTGFLVPIRSPEAIADRLAWCADHREEVVAMGREAQKKASTYTWTHYADTILAAIRGESEVSLSAVGSAEVEGQTTARITTDYRPDR